MKFTYVKTGDDISERECLVINKPSPHYFMFEIDHEVLGDLDVTHEALTKAFTEFQETRKQQMYDFAKQYGLSIKFFNPEKMEKIRD